jgi:protein SCO1/2
VGRSVRLGDYFGQKPVILALVAYECRMLCPLRLEGLVHSLRALSLSAGEQFAVVTVSVDPRESPALAAAVKRQYMQQYARPGAEKGWHFLTGEERAIEQLASAAGFRYAYVAQQDQYVHANGITVLTPQGTIARYFYGIEYAPRDLRLALLEASAGKVGSLVDQVLLLCYRYDPTTGRYSAVALRSVRLGGLLTVLALGSFIGVMWHRERLGKRGKIGRVR